MQIPRAQSDILKCLLLFDQQSNYQRYSLYSLKSQRKAWNPHISEAGTKQRLSFSSLFLCLKNEKMNQLSSVNSFSSKSSHLRCWNYRPSNRFIISALIIMPAVSWKPFTERKWLTTPSSVAFSFISFSFVTKSTGTKDGLLVWIEYIIWGSGYDTCRTKSRAVAGGDGGTFVQMLKWMNETAFRRGDRNDAKLWKTLPLFIW